MYGFNRLMYGFHWIFLFLFFYFLGAAYSIGMSSNQDGILDSVSGVSKCISLALGVINGSSLVIAFR